MSDKPETQVDERTERARRNQELEKVIAEHADAKRVPRNPLDFVQKGMQELDHTADAGDDETKDA
jgi:hypothetical protein